MKYLAIDLGARRTGLAIGDDLTGVVTPLKVIHAASESMVLDSILDQIDSQAPTAIVIGLPLNMDGTESPGSAGARRFGEKLSEACGLQVHFQDERLTSFAAEQQLAGSGLTHDQKKNLRDALAAAAILEDFLGQS